MVPPEEKRERERPETRVWMTPPTKLARQKGSTGPQPSRQRARNQQNKTKTRSAAIDCKTRGGARGPRTTVRPTRANQELSLSRVRPTATATNDDDLDDNDGPAHERAFEACATCPRAEGERTLSLERGATGSVKKKKAQCRLVAALVFGSPLSTPLASHNRDA